MIQANIIGKQQIRLIFYINSNKLDTKQSYHSLNIQDPFYLLYSLLYQIIKLHQSTVVSFLLLPYLETIIEYHSLDGQKPYYNFQSQSICGQCIAACFLCLIYPLLCYFSNMKGYYIPSPLFFLLIQQTQNVLSSACCHCVSTCGRRAKKRQTSVGFPLTHIHSSCEGGKIFSCCWVKEMLQNQRSGVRTVCNIRQGKGLLQLHRIKFSFPQLQEKENQTIIYQKSVTSSII